MNHYDITFKGYRRDCNKSGLPHYSGIYIVYRCRYIPETDKVQLSKIIYIGQAEDINERLNNHEKYNDFLAECAAREEICYAYANVAVEELDIIENALIFAQKPELNTQLVDSFNHEASSFTIDGACALLEHTDYSIS